MKNNYGFGKFEVLTVIVLLLVIFAFLAYSFLGGTTAHKIDTMKDNAISFSKVVTTNIASFHNTEHVYLGEAIDEGLIGEIKNPVGRGHCSKSDSLVELVDGMPYVTLQCGNLLIEKANFTGTKEVTSYKVSEWSEEKKDGYNDEMVMYNCEDDGEEVFEEYYPELYFVYQVNKKYETSYYFQNNVGRSCKVISKTYYRSKTLVE